MEKEILLVGLEYRAYGLSRLGYQVFNYEDQYEAIEALRHRKSAHQSMPDLVLIRGFLEDNNSFGELLGWLEGLSTKIPAIVFDTELTHRKSVEAQDLGADDYMHVDVSDQKLYRQITRLTDVSCNRGLRDHAKKYDYQTPLWKRVFDITLAGSLILLLLPLFLLIALAIKLESKGPIIYMQSRVGSGYKIFKFFKFRSMYQQADQMVRQLEHQNSYSSNPTQQPASTTNLDASNQEILIADDQLVTEESHLIAKSSRKRETFNKFKNDPRITKVGKIIRNCSIDELPQLFNVILGDMSIVGNRPLPLYEAEMLTDDKWAERFLGPAGITGLWQVTERGKSNASAESRKALDNQYTRHFNFWNDLKILLKTPIAAFQQENL
ncbi:MAG: sugar transferase [Cyclobacteriaceae bacterium]|nr:sugar transferase [Cyclobacteriaceae bacterium HetDA_MAG_MS6]